MLQVITIPPQNSPATSAIVILHGWGSTAEDAAQFAEILKVPGAVKLMPRGLFQHPYNPAGQMWYDIPNVGRFDFRIDLSDRSDLQRSRQVLRDWLTTLPEQTGVPLQKTILGGFSQGGAMTIELGLDFPFAGLMSLSGYAHRPINPVTNAPKLLMTHGTADNVVPIAASRATRDALIKAGVEVESIEFPGLGHEISWEVLDRMQSFIVKQLGNSK
jgi:phospholipase/carboxylesterase